MINKNLQKTIALLHKFRDERDWMQFHNPKDMAIAVSIEANELLELFLWKDSQEVEEFIKDKNNRQEVKEELADIFNFAIELADNLGIDIEEAMREKLAKNAKKYPVHKAKGKAEKYNKL